MNKRERVLTEVQEAGNKLYKMTEAAASQVCQAIAKSDRGLKLVLDTRTYFLNRDNTRLKVTGLDEGDVIVSDLGMDSQYEFLMKDYPRLIRVFSLKDIGEE